MAQPSRAELKRLIDKLPDGERETARQALQALIDKAAGEPNRFSFVPHSPRRAARELPHVSRSEGAVTVIYDPTQPRPSPEDIGARLQVQESGETLAADEQAPTSAEREWQESEADNRGQSDN